MDDLLLEYADTFGEGFPMYQIGRTRSETEIVNILKDCLEKNKDAYSLGYCTDEIDYQY